MEVMNHDLVGLYNRINRFLVEMQKSVSANQGEEVTVFDVDRLMSYLDAIEHYQKWMQGEPQLDLPETAPRKYLLEEAPLMEPVENESCNDACRMLIICRDELTNSQSARRPGGLNKFDDSRLSSICRKLRSFVTDYIGKALPLDLPESSPRSPSSGPGRMGIEPS